MCCVLVNYARFTADTLSQVELNTVTRLLNVLNTTDKRITLRRNEQPSASNGNKVHLSERAKQRCQLTAIIDLV